MSFRIFNFDPTFSSADKTAVTCFIPTGKHEYSKSLRATDRTKYNGEKRRIAGNAIKIFEDRFPAAKGKLEVADIATPATVIHYTGNWNGSMEGWLMTPSTGVRQLPICFPSLKNFYMAGQWLGPGSVLPSGLLTERKVVRRICRDHHKKFRPDPIW